ncbi:hypothetical protein PIB30_050597 [Stylosanthes scabra]|uniref:Uncharacterized protein n=1 Tax=Stylosanthes scabra TaxID=79078 RepID=A0ABU6VIH7_9FABA|nr:hypothetical protein [Stylosanthes scabra]
MKMSFMREAFTMDVMIGARRLRCNDHHQSRQICTRSRTEDLSDAVNEIRRGAEDDAVVKGNVENTVVEPAEVENNVNDGTESSAEVGASAKEKQRTIVAGVDATMTDGGLRARQLR